MKEIVDYLEIYYTTVSKMMGGMNKKEYFKSLSDVERGRERKLF